MAEIILSALIILFDMQSALKNICGEERRKNSDFLNVPEKNVWASENMIRAKTIWNHLPRGQVGLEIIF